MADGAAEGGPAVHAAPGQGLVGVPRGAERARRAQAPPVLVGIVEVVRGPHIVRRLARGRGGGAGAAVALAVGGAVLARGPAESPLAAAQLVRARSPARLPPAVLRRHAAGDDTQSHRYRQCHGTMTHDSNSTAHFFIFFIWGLEWLEAKMCVRGGFI